LARRYVGQATIDVTFDDAYRGEPGRFYYRGRMTVGDQSWTSRGFGSPMGGWGPGVAADSPQAYDCVAASVVQFFTYFTPDNRRGDEDLTDYPPGDMSSVFAGAVDEARGDDRGRLEVRRRKDGPMKLVA